MAAFDFPPTPAVGTLYPLVAEVGKPQYRWNGSEWIAATLDPAGYVRKSGDAMTGALSLAGDPTQALHAVPKQYLDAQRQRISLAGGKQFDVQVPTGAIAVRVNGVVWPTTATSMTLAIQLSVAAGVFRNTAGDYRTSGFYHTTSTPNAIGGMQLITTFTGMVLENSHSTTATPVVFSGTLGLKRPTVTANFVGDFMTATYTTDNIHYALTSYLIPAAAGSALDVLALRFVAATGDNFDAGSYLNVEWVF